MNIDIESSMYITLLVFAGVLLCILLGAIFFDIKYSLLTHKIKKQGNELLPECPHITILVYLSNNTALDVKKCLQSIVENNYETYDVVIIENSSIDKKVRLQIKTLLRYSFANLHTYYYASRRKRSVASAYQEAYRRSVKGELVLLITADDTIVSHAIKTLVNLQSVQSSVSCFLLPEVSASLTVESAYADIVRASRGMVYKIRALINTYIKLIPAPGMMVRNRELQKRGELYVQYLYVPDVQILKSTYIRGMQFTPMARASVVVMTVVYLTVGTCLWLAITSDVEQPFIIAWIIASTWSVLTVLQAEALPIEKRLYLLSISFLSLYFYIVFSLASLFLSGWATIKKI